MPVNSTGPSSVATNISNNAYSSSSPTSSSTSSQVLTSSQPSSLGSLESFDPYDEDSWFFGYMSRSDATELLASNQMGSFLVRESTSAKGDLVLTVKESADKISHYIINRTVTDRGKTCFKIGEQIFFEIPTLLTFYKLNNLDDTPLRRAATPRDTELCKRSFTKDYLAEATELTAAPVQRKLPCKARVIQNRIPNAYDKTALTLREGDIVLVTKADISGCWDGEISGKRGHFPFNCVKFLDETD